MGKSYKKQFGASERNVKRNLLRKWYEKDRAQFITAGKSLIGEVLQGEEGCFFKNPSGEIHKIFINSVEGDEKEIEFDSMKVESTDYRHHPENKRTWGKIRG